MTTKLLLIDFQNDFITGSLAVTGATQDVKNTIDFIKRKQDVIDKVIFTADMHPKRHVSFASNWNEFAQGETRVDLNSVFVTKEAKHSVFDSDALDQYLYELNDTLSLYPDHCVAGTDGALLHLELEEIVDMCFGCQQTAYLKGMNARFEQYSAAYSYDNGINYKFLDDIKECDKIYVAGEALDYCVLKTLDDLVSFGIPQEKFYILSDCTSVIDGNTSDKVRWLKENTKYKIVNSKEV